MMIQKKFISNSLLLLIGVAVLVSGLVIQINYHIVGKSNSVTTFGLCKQDWAELHLWSSSLFTVVLIYHIWDHRKWFKNLITKGVGVNQRVTFILILLTIITVCTGFISFIESSKLTKVFIEIHDKVGLLFFVFTIIHVVKRFKWYLSKLKTIVN